MTGVLEIGRKLDVWRGFQFHRRWERQPVILTLVVLAGLTVAAAVELLPSLLLGNTVPNASVEPYTPLELAGREIFVSEGCANCHSQMVRPLVAETKRFDTISTAGDSMYDRPSQWGSRRIGPDLANEGGKQSSYWHWLHLGQPEATSPGSVMPSYSKLLEQQLKFGAIPARVQTAAYLGVPYSEATLENSEAMARRQAKVVAADIVRQGGPPLTHEQVAVALIAFLQRLGK
jgi:cytochrome c oxidase cbb3-type subunit I/II